MHTYFRVSRVQHGLGEVVQVNVIDGQVSNPRILDSVAKAKREAFASAANLSLIMHEPATVDLLGERYTVVVTKQNV